MLQSLMSCFACGDKQSSNVVAPENIKPSQIKVAKLNQSDIKTDDNKSRISMTTVTFLTSETAPSKEQNDDQQIRRRIQLFRKKDLPQRKAMESEFVRQNLVRSNVIYLIDKSWSEQYTQFLKNQKKTAMPPINNQKLLDSQNQLKTTAKERQDYFIVTQKIWKLVHGLYGGGPTIAKDYCFPVMPLSMKRLMIPPAGIENPKNLCFMIAVLQMLISIQQLNGYMLKKQYMQNAVNDSKKKNSHHIYQRMLKQYAQTPTDPKIIEIKQFADFFEQKFNPNEQHDAHEFFLSFAQHIQQQMKLDISSLAKTPNNPQPIYNNYFLQHKSMIDKIFAGQQQTIVNCVSCQYKSKTYLPFLQIVLSIVGLSTIEQCLDNYFESQKLKDLYQCENCKKKTKAIKSTCITKTPNYLLLVLGKFSCTTQKKIQHKVDYGHQLSIKKHCFGHCGDTNYLLQSIIIHKGTKSTKGHYYTLTRRGNKWCYFNDSSFQQIEEKDIVGRDPYMLVYERVKST